MVATRKPFETRPHDHSLVVTRMSDREYDAWRPHGHDETRSLKRVSQFDGRGDCSIKDHITRCGPQANELEPKLVEHRQWFSQATFSAVQDGPREHKILQHTRSTEGL